MGGKEEKNERGKEEKEHKMREGKGDLKLFFIYKSMRRFFHMLSGKYVLI